MSAVAEVAADLRSSSSVSWRINFWLQTSDAFDVYAVLRRWPLETN